MPTPSPVAADATGLADSSWISRVRDALRDYPKYTVDTWTSDGSAGVVSFTGVPLTVSKPPINFTGDTPSGTTTSLLVRDNTAGQNYTVITTGTPTSTQVLVNHDTGEIQWLAAPAVSHAIQISYQAVRWTDASISAALYAGLRAMFPRVGKTYVDTSIPIQVNVWDYTLPLWCQDPRARPIKVEIADPYIATEPFVPMDNWERVGLTQLHIPRSQRYSPVARLRITGWGPYLSLGDLEPQLYELPKWYALGVLLPHQETKRIREDQMVPLTQEGGQAPGLLVQTGDYFARRFEQELDRLARNAGPGYAVGIRTVYQRARH